MRSRERVRAGRAAQAIRGSGFDIATELPTLLQKSGLLATLAYLFKKGEHSIIGAFFDHWRDRESGMPELPPGAPLELYRGWLRPQTALTGQQLRLLTAEAMAFAAWLKREAQIQDTPSGQTDP